MKKLPFLLIIILIFTFFTCELFNSDENSDKEKEDVIISTPTPSPTPSITITGYNGQTLYSSYIDLSADLININEEDRILTWTLVSGNARVYNSGEVYPNCAGDVVVKVENNNNISDQITLDFEEFRFVNNEGWRWENEPLTSILWFHGNGRVDIMRKMPNFGFWYPKQTYLWSTNNGKLTISDEVVNKSYSFTNISAENPLFRFDLESSGAFYNKPEPID